MENNYKEDLVDKYNKGLCNKEEKSLVETWFQEWRGEGYTPSKEQIERVSKEVWDHLHELEIPATQTKVINWPFRIITAAAILIAVLGIATYFFVQTSLPSGFKNDVEPGKNEATLTLADGSTISLDATSNGTISNNSGIKITKNANGQVIYSSLPAGISPQRGERGLALNTITTPRGGQYQIILPDGTHVWLNAASKLIYPISFNGREDRRVELSGEAYFEVTKNKAQPFIVTSQKQKVQVLGTHFNISSYPDEPNTKTTLLEGSVKVSLSSLAPSSFPPSSLRGGTTNRALRELSAANQPQPHDQIVLSPNQQSINSGTSIQIKTEGIEDAIAWKDGEFSFRQEPLESIMLKISRWYNVDVIYENKQARRKIFGGTISKFEKVSEVLCMLQLAGDVKFKVEGRRITVE